MHSQEHLLGHLPEHPSHLRDECITNFLFRSKTEERVF